MIKITPKNNKQEILGEKNLGRYTFSESQGVFSPFLSFMLANKMKEVQTHILIFQPANHYRRCRFVLGSQLRVSGGFLRDAANQTFPAERTPADSAAVGIIPPTGENVPWPAESTGRLCASTNARRRKAHQPEPVSGLSGGKARRRLPNVINIPLLVFTSHTQTEMTNRICLVKRRCLHCLHAPNQGGKNQGGKKKCSWQYNHSVKKLLWGGVSRGFGEWFFFQKRE